VKRHPAGLLIAVLIGACWRLAAAADSLELEGTTITGNRELPKALHIVPWKSAVPGELAARPMQSLLDEVLAPADPDVVRRELDYYESVHVFRQGVPVESNTGGR
jgi:hypothetical protein